MENQRLLKVQVLIFHVRSLMGQFGIQDSEIQKDSSHRMNGQVISNNAKRCIQIPHQIFSRLNADAESDERVGETGF